MEPRTRLDPTLLAKRISGRRLALRYDQREVADRAGLSRAYISRLETGLVANPKVFDLELVARALDLPLHELFAPPDDPPPWTLEGELRAAGVAEWLIKKTLDSAHGEPESIQRILARHAIAIWESGEARPDGGNQERKHA